MLIFFEYMVNIYLYMYLFLDSRYYVKSLLVVAPLTRQLILVHKHNDDLFHTRFPRLHNTSFEISFFV